MNNQTIVDQAERERALDIGSSFIVRAPAGSGKTRLLIQRYLALLAIVDAPEEVIAITFTRKAAAEMRARVMNALRSVTDANVIEDEQTRLLAARVLARDHARQAAGDGWQLMANQARLRIQTIDSMNASLTRQMPMLARFGAQPESVDDASPLYQQAAQNLVAQINSGNAENSAVVDDLATLLTHLDNNLLVVERLIAEMLRARDHWLRNLPKMHARELLEAALSRVSERGVAEMAAIFPSNAKSETLALLRFSGQNLLKDGVNRALSSFADIDAFPTENVADLSAWLAVADLLLTKENEWRSPRGIDKRMGFPTSKIKDEKAVFDAMKERLRSLLAALAESPSAPRLLRTLAALRALPPSGYDEQEWNVLGAIVRLLPTATAHLWEVFGREGQCDFTEIAQAASRSLGDDDAPTDLALSLDYRIQHLLVDEFQDTSYAQFSLLEKLTRGWSAGDGRTLFVVGDPMQSIYRFREAEVGLFLRAREVGIGSVSLQSITLRVNFRSQASVVEWVNQTFSQLMPSEETTANNTGVVPYSASIAFHQQSETIANGVSLHWHYQNSHDDVKDDVSKREAADVVRVIKASLAAQENIPTESTNTTNTTTTIAILVRNRTHLSEIIPALKAANIAFQAVDIDPLRDRPVVQDLFALTRAVLHLADRIAWLAVLRAPYCGLTINDLAALTNSATPINASLLPDSRTIWEMMCDEARLALLSTGGQQRLKACREVMAQAIQARHQSALFSLRDVVEQTWLALRGPACLRLASELEDANTFLNLLESEAAAQSDGNQINDLSRLESRVDRLFSGNRIADDGQPACVQIMTIHKAKGLEFDTVIVPGLHRSPRNDDQKLLVWSEESDPESGERELLLAPIRETGADDDADLIYQYIAGLDRAKQQHENVRLMYVAATRAVHSLHFFATLNVKDNDGGAEVAVPKQSSLLNAIWPAIETTATPNDFAAVDHEMTSAATPNDIDSLSTEIANTHCTRLPDDFHMPEMAATILAITKTNVDADELTQTTTTINFEWASDAARHIGIVVHAVLQTIAEDGLDRWPIVRIEQSRPLFAEALMAQGMVGDSLADGVNRVVSALIRTLNDPRGRWTLDQHHDARSEWRLTGLKDGALINIAIDRTFVDEDGIRWIIDFKTGSHEGADVDAFLDNEVKRYRAQLETYAELVAMLKADKKPIRLGLYFPMLNGWREWRD